jgi:ABC-type sugar transport system substrate-binding protein
MNASSKEAHSFGIYDTTSRNISAPVLIWNKYYLRVRKDLKRKVFKEEVKMKKILIVTLCAVMALVMFASCSSPSSDAPADEGAATEEPEQAAAEDESAAPAEEEGTTAEGEGLKIGYIENFAAHEFYQNVIKGMQETADAAGYTLEVSNADGDVAKQISIGENMLAKDVDVLIVTPVDAAGVMPLIDQATAAGVPVITESVPATSQTCYVGIDDYSAGVIDGKAAGEYAKANGITPKLLVVGFPALEVCVDRSEGFKAGLKEVIPEMEVATEVDGQGAKDEAVKVATDAITAHPDVNMIMGINDDSTIGGLLAAESSGLDMSKVCGFGFGVEGIAAKALLADPTSSYKGGLGMFPENIGRLCVEYAAKAANGEEVPVAITVPTAELTSDNVTEYYTQEGTDWIIDWDKVKALEVVPRDTLELER